MYFLCAQNRAQPRATDELEGPGWADGKPGPGPPPRANLGGPPGELRRRAPDNPHRPNHQRVHPTAESFVHPTTGRSWIPKSREKRIPALTSESSPGRRAKNEKKGGPKTKTGNAMHCQARLRSQGWPQKAFLNQKRCDPAMRYQSRAIRPSRPAPWGSVLGARQARNRCHPSLRAG